MIDERIIEEIIASNDIISVIEQYLPLSKTGSNFKACCPFHEENTPSFVVSEKKQIYKCFGCGKGGNVLHFVKEIEKISFYEAIRKLASSAGIVLKQDSPQTVQKRSRTGLILSVYELAKDHYHNNLCKFGDKVNEYLKNRGISSEVTKRFELGYALNSSTGLYNYLIKNHINKDIIVQSGLIADGKYGNYDIFRERLIFPIHSSSGKVVAFGARILEGSQSSAKYINSPTTPIYTKGNELYGFFLTRTEIGRKNSALVTEGYLDFIKLYEAGFTNSVAALGTALTEKQINLLSRYTSNYYLLFDGDNAGRKAAVEAAKKIIIAGKSPFIVEFPPDLDADSFLQKHGPDKLNELINNAKKLPFFLAEDRLSALSTKEKIEALVELIGKIPDMLTAELFIKEVAEVFKVSQQSLLSKLRTLRKPVLKKPTEKQERGSYSRFPEERDFLVYFLNGAVPDSDMLEDISPDFFFIDAYKKVFELFIKYGYNIDDSKLMSVLTALEDKDPVLVSTISELSMKETPQLPLESVIIDLRLRKLKMELHNNKQDNNCDQSKVINRVKELEERNAELKRLSNRVVKNIL